MRGAAAACREGAPDRVRSAAWKTLSRWRRNTRSVLRVHIENNMSIWCSWSRGGSNSAPRRARRAPWPAICSRSCATGPANAGRVSIASEGGAPTLAEQKQGRKTARFEGVAQEPMVRAVLDRFPGAEIVAVRDVVAEDVAAPMPDKDE